MIGDLNNDGLSEVVATTYQGSLFAGIYSFLRVCSLGGVHSYGSNSYQLNYVPSSPNSNAGTIVFSGAVPYSTVYFAIGTAAANIPYSGGTILIDPNSLVVPNLIAVQTDATGSISYSMGVRSAPLAGQSVFVQGFDGNLQSSNALQVTFVP